MAGKIKPMSQIKQLSTVMAVFQQTLNKKGCPFDHYTESIFSVKRLINVLNHIGVGIQFSLRDAE